MNWLIAGLAYAAAYAAVVSLLGGAATARLWVGNIGLLLPPLVPIAIVLVRRRGWTGHHRVFWDAIAAGAALWLAGQIPWAISELFLQLPLSFLDWVVVPQLCGSLMPLLALVAWPHRGPRPETTLTAVLDVYALVGLAAFAYSFLIVIPGLASGHAVGAIRTLAIAGPAVRVLVIAGLLLAIRSAGSGPWVTAYQRLLMGAAISLLMLIALSMTVSAEQYRSGSIFDVGWILAFWFYGWAAATTPRSPAQGSRSMTDAARSAPPALLFACLAAVPIVGYGCALLFPLGGRYDVYRAVLTAATLVFGLAMIMVRSIVERRALRHADRQIRLLAAAFEESDELILIIRKGSIRYANDALCRATGYTPAELGALPPRGLIPQMDEATAALFDVQLTQRQIVHVDITIARKDGTLFRAACTGVPIVEEGTVTDVVGIVRDLTDDLRLQAQIVRSERMSAIGELLSAVTHELTNPLQSVVGTIGVLIESGEAQAVRPDLERAARAAGHAVRIVRDLQAFVRRAPIERVLADLSEIVQSVLAPRAGELRAAHIELRQEFAAGLPLVLAKSIEIQQAVLNLIVNAQEAMAAEGGGVLTIRTFLSGTDAALDVCDDGPGVRPDVAARIFEPFFTTRGPQARSGLGLSAAYGIASAHGGTLELVPAERGACFRLTLPGAGFPGPAHIHYN